MKSQNKKAIFICQISEEVLKVIKCLIINNTKRSFSDLEVEAIPQNLEEKELIERLNKLFKKLQYHNSPVIISLPRNQTTCRYLKVPSQSPQEIENIANLQASYHLPYQNDELITGYQVIRVDKEGYSHINLVIVHRDVIERYIKIFKELKTTGLTITVSSYGLCNLYNYLESEETAADTIIVDVDLPHIELAIVSADKLLFSRSFNLTQERENWHSFFIEELNKTKDTYLKETQNKVADKVVIVGALKKFQECPTILSEQLALPVSILSYEKKAFASQDFLNRMLEADNSLASLIGLGLYEIPASLNLLPQSLKGESRKSSQRKERLRLGLLTLSIIIIWVLGIAKNLENKSNYLQQLKIELNKIANEAQPLEEIEKRFQALESRLQKNLSRLDILYELYQLKPSQVSLINFTYEDNQILLHGQTQEVNSVFAFVSQLGKSAVFKDFNIKVRYATQKKTQSGEFWDFEIIFLKNVKSP